MNWLHALRLRIRTLLKRDVVEQELDDELRFHIEMQTEENLRRGMSPEEARRQAILLFGGVEGHKEACRDARGLGWLEEVRQDAGYGLRVLRRSPGFAAVAVLTLALGIGATTAVFSIVDGVLLRPLVYPEAERLFVLWEQSRQGGLRPASYPAFEDWREQSEAFSEIAYIRGEDVVIRDPEGSRRLIGAFASGDFFQMMGTAPLLGRTFSHEGSGDARVAVLSHRLWLQHYGGDPGVLRQTLPTPHGPLTVIGVMPPGFVAPVWADLWLPLEALPPSGRYALSQRNLHADSQIMGRLAPGMSPERAEAEMATIAARLAAAYPDDSEWTRVSLSSLREQVLGDVDSRLLVLGLAVALVLLVACVNIANLQLARASVRTREFAVRAALGAGRSRLLRQMLTESVLLGIAGGAIGVVLAAVGIRMLRSAAIAEWSADPVLPRLYEVVVDGRVLAFALAISLAAAVLFGVLPALRASTTDLLEPLKSATPGASSSREILTLRAALVVGQVALALMLMVGAGLLIRTFWELQRAELGFEPERVVTVRIFPPSPRYADAAAAGELYRRLREAAAAVPGVRDAALANHLPLVGGAMPTRMITGGEPPAGGELVLYRTVSPEYFSTLGTPLVRGRPLGTEDMAGPGGVVINETAAREFWPGEDPIGRSVTVHKAAQSRPDLGEPITAQVVGIVGDERFFDLSSPPPPAVFVPYTWNPWDNIFLAVRAEGDPSALIPALRRAVLEVDPDLPVAGPGFQTEFHTIEEYLAGNLESQRFNATLLGAFAASAFLLAIIGIFGVMMYLVVRRTREIGVRIALGARPRDVVRQIAGQTLRLAALGIALGLAGSLAATRLLRSLLHGVSATDPAVFAFVVGSFLLAAVVAGLFPARRAAQVDPVVALRADQ
jgi:putative ABC transport system permease protein